MKPFLTCFLVASFYLFQPALMTNPEVKQVLAATENHPRVKSIKLSTGVKLEYVEQGDISGNPVIFLHGYTDSWHSFESVMRNLPANLHAFAISQRGHGNSQRPETGYDLEEFANDLADFIRKLKLGPVIVAGHSMGGIITQQFAISYPELVKGIVIISSDACIANNPGIPEFGEQINQLSDPVSFEFANEFQRSTCANPIDSLYFQTLVKESMKLPAPVWKKVMDGMMKADLSRDITTINKPTLLLWGDKDLICSRSDQDVLLAGIKQSKLIVYQETGHALHWEQPARFTKDLIDFISNNIR